MSPKLHVGNLPADATEQTVRDLFSKAGIVMTVTMVQNLLVPSARPSAFVEMSSMRETEAAVAQLDGLTVGSDMLMVRMARPGEAPRRFHNRNRPRRDLGL